MESSYENVQSKEIYIKSPVPKRAVVHVIHSDQSAFNDRFAQTSSDTESKVKPQLSSEQVKTQVSSEQVKTQVSSEQVKTQVSSEQVKTQVELKLDYDLNRITIEARNTALKQIEEDVAHIGETMTILAEMVKDQESPLDRIDMLIDDAVYNVEHGTKHLQEAEKSMNWKRKLWAVAAGVGGVAVVALGALVVVKTAPRLQ